MAPASKMIGAGNLIYGLFRSRALELAGVFPRVYRPDVYLLIELSLYGDIRMVPETLWYRRDRSTRSPSRPADIMESQSNPRKADVPLEWWARMIRVVGLGPVSRQHRFLFPQKVPLYSRLPSNTQHAGLFFWRLSICGRGLPVVGRRAGAAHASRLLLSRRSSSRDRQSRDTPR